MRLQELARFWNATPEERTASYPCDHYLNSRCKELAEHQAAAA